MKTLFEQLSPYTHKKDTPAFRRVEVITYQFSKDGINCNYIDSNGIAKSSFRMYEKESQVKGIDTTNLEVLPYFADVIEDIPGYLKFKPKTYVAAQLMVERKGLYQYYKHEGSKEPLLIAMNSNIISEYR